LGRIYPRSLRSSYNKLTNLPQHSWGGFFFKVLFFYDYKKN